MNVKWMGLECEVEETQRPLPMFHVKQADRGPFRKGLTGV